MALAWASAKSALLNSDFDDELSAGLKFSILEILVVDVAPVVNLVAYCWLKPPLKP